MKISTDTQTRSLAGLESKSEMVTDTSILQDKLWNFGEVLKEEQRLQIDNCLLTCCNFKDMQCGGAVAKPVFTSSCSFTIPTGTYRTSQAIVISDTSNFTLHGKGAELIAENFTLNINVLSNNNFSMVGPTTLDADPFGFTQASLPHWLTLQLHC